jgi:2'-5' RNA ligase
VAVDHFAVALVLPDEVEKILKRLRGEYARHMKYIDIPHVSLVYPFEPRVDKILVAEKLKEVAGKTKPFRLELNGIRYFEGENNTAYLAVADPKPVVDLHYAIGHSLSDMAKDDYGLKFSFVKFIPHVTIGDAIAADILPRVKESLSRTTPHCEFTITDFSLLAEEDAGKWGITEKFMLAG